MIYIRSIYRTIELLQGWTGYLITHEIYFIVLDGTMMVLAVGIFNLIHPAWFSLGDIQDRKSMRYLQAEVDEGEEIELAS